MLPAVEIQCLNSTGSLLVERVERIYIHLIYFFQLPGIIGSGTFQGMELFISSEPIYILLINLNPVIMKKYVCTACGYVYDPASGDPENGIAPGTAFEDLPDDWTCPVCGVSKDMFEPES